VGTEIERKFRLRGAPEWLGDHDSARIEQGYLAIEEGDGAEVRLRRRGADTLLTVKRGSGRTRDEEEVEVSESQFEALWPLTEGRRLAKVRYLVPHDGHTVEVDVFEGDLGELAMGEVEFDSEAASDEFEPPDWLGEEVTGDPRYANEALAVDGMPEEGDC
jgi:CYTH domain-containing protein